jgi:hypothetical protein
MNLMFDFPLCQECHEEIRRFNICILRTKTKEMMNESRIFKSDYCGSIIFDRGGS